MFIFSIFFILTDTCFDFLEDFVRSYHASPTNYTSYYISLTLQEALFNGIMIVSDFEVLLLTLICLIFWEKNKNQWKLCGVSEIETFSLFFSFYVGSYCKIVAQITKLIDYCEVVFEEKKCNEPYLRFNLISVCFNTGIMNHGDSECEYYEF